MNRVCRWMSLCVLISTLGAATAARARADFSMTLADSINGEKAQGHLLASFRTVTTGEVALTLDASGLVKGEYVASWGFNIDPSYKEKISISRPRRLGGRNGPGQGDQRDEEGDQRG